MIRPHASCAARRDMMTKFPADGIDIRMTISIDVWSDLLCPFCYIGARHLELALARFEPGIATLRWRSFQLDPAAERVSALSNAERLARKYGRTVAWARQLHVEIARRGEAVGLRFDFDRVTPTNSFDAHRLTHLATARGLGNAAQHRLFEAHFAHGQSMGDRLVLQAAGEAIGLDADEVRALLAGDEFGDAVRTDIDKARDIGITGVPFFLFNRQLMISGAQPVDVFVAALDRAGRPPAPSSIDEA
jgi:predicted DsbA family dithiol-disulfide isomerase